jgi:hypothetical protein
MLKSFDEIPPTYLYIEYATKTIYELDIPALYSFYKCKGIDAKDVGYKSGFEVDFINPRIAAGDPLFKNQNLSTIEKGLTMRFITNSKGAKFATLEDAVAYAKQNKLSAASDGVIKANIKKNIDGKQKVAYGLTWSIVEEHADFSDYAYIKRVAPPRYFIPGSPFCSLIGTKKDWAGSYPS